MTNEIQKFCELGEKLGIVQLDGPDNAQNAQGHMLIENNQDGLFATFEDHSHGEFYHQAVESISAIKAMLARNLELEKALPKLIADAMFMAWRGSDNGYNAECGGDRLTVDDFLVNAAVFARKALNAGES